MKQFNLSILIFIVLLVSSCTQTTDQQSIPTIPESAECLTNTAYSGSSTITGTAKFYKRTLNNNFQQSDPIASPLPIRYAEVQVLDSTGTFVQCGRTDGNGNIKATDMSSNLRIPDTAGTYTIKVLSRSNVTIATGVSGKAPLIHHTSVKKDIYSNDVHQITTTVTSSGNGSYPVTMTAYARETVDPNLSGGAFNIYNDALSMYIYLGQNTGAADLTCVNNKLNIYWQAGFNPAQYIYPFADPGALSPLSFYNRGYNELYISGGRNGNIKTQDSDHFDDTVVLHELGHYLEDACGGMDSPGGSHYGLYRSDPRLMWSEGWGNFVGVHMLRNNLSSIYPNIVNDSNTSDGWRFYLDTKGYNDSTVSGSVGTVLIKLNMAKNGNSTAEGFSLANPYGGNVYYDKVDAVNNPGEGHFREISIARSLFKGTNTCTSSSYCSGTNYFPQYWLSFERRSAGIGMGNSRYAFRNSSLFWNRLAEVTGTFPAAIDNMLNNDEAQQRESNLNNSVTGAIPYGIKLKKQASACSSSIKIRPVANSLEGSGWSDDQRNNSHFFRIDSSSLIGVTSINLLATYSSGTTGIDHDLIIYSENYRFDEDCAGYLDNNNHCSLPQKVISADMVVADRSVGNSKSVYVSSLNSLQRYLLVVKAFTMPYSSIAASTEYTYNLTVTGGGGGYLCPDIY